MLKPEHRLYALFLCVKFYTVFSSQYNITLFCNTPRRSSVLPSLPVEKFTLLLIIIGVRIYKNKYKWTKWINVAISWNVVMPDYSILNLMFSSCSFGLWKGVGWVVWGILIGCNIVVETLIVREYVGQQSIDEMTAVRCNL